MSIDHPATKTFLFFAYQYYIRSFMVKGQENKILEYIKCYPPQKSTLYYLFNQDIALEYSSLTRRKRSIDELNKHLLKQKNNNSTYWLNHEKSSIGKKSAETVKYYADRMTYEILPYGIFPIRLDKHTDEVSYGFPNVAPTRNDESYSMPQDASPHDHDDVRIINGFDKEYTKWCLRLFIDNDLVLTDDFFYHNESDIISKYLNCHKLINKGKDISTPIQMTNRVLGLWIFDSLIKHNITLYTPEKMIEEAGYHFENLDPARIARIYKRTLQCIMSKDVLPISNSN